MKLITWNIQWCRGCDGRVDPGRIVDTASALADFDVLCLQEVADGFPGLAGSRGENQFAILSSLLPHYQAIEGVGVDVNGKGGSRARFGNLLLSRLPVLGVWRHLLAWPADPKAVGMQRVAVEAVLDTGAGLLRVVTTHLEYYSTRQRLAQVDHLRALQVEASSHCADPTLEKHVGSPFETRKRPASALLCGDFNFRVDSEDYSRILAPFPHGDPWRDAWTIAHPGLTHAHTNGVHDRIQWPESYTCDFIFITDDLAPAVKRVEVDSITKASDHQPVLIELDCTKRRL